MKNERQITFASIVESHLIDKVHYARHVKINTMHTAEIYTKNYRQSVFALDAARTYCMATKKAALIAEQNQPKPRQKCALLMQKNTMSNKKYGEKQDMKKTERTAYAHAVVKGKQIQDIKLAHIVEKQ